MAVLSFFQCSDEYTRYPAEERTHLRAAIVLNYTSILEELMKTLTFGFHYSKLAGAEAEYQKTVNPKYYRGLTIRGAKKDRLGAM